MTIRAQAGLWVLTALPLLFLLPATQGLRYPLVCTQPTAVAFSLGPGASPGAASSLADSPPACGALALELQVRRIHAREVVLRPVITNDSGRDWHGTVALDITGLGTVPVSIGRVGAGTSRGADVRVDLPPGSEEISGKILLGP